jgi:PST family polysaccharide transporter
MGDRGAMLIQRIFRDAAWLGVIQILNFGLPLLTVPVAARAFGPVTFGILATITAYSAYAGLVSGFGFHFSGPRILGLLHRDKPALSKAIGEIYGAISLLGFVSILFFCALAAVLGIARGHFDVLVLTVLQWVAAMMSPPWLFVAVDLARGLTLLQFVFRLSSALAILSVIREERDLTLYAAINSVASVGLSISAVIMLQRSGFKLPMPNPKAIISIIRNTFRLFLTAVSTNLYTNSNVLVIASILNPSSAGLFSLADRIRNATLNIFGPITQSMYPFLCRIVGRDSTMEEKKAKLIFFSSILALSVGISVILFLAADSIVGFLGGDRFKNAGVILRWMSAVPFLVSVQQILTVTMLPLGLERQFSNIVTAAGFLGISIMFGLTLSLGLFGSGMAVFATEASITLALAISLSRYVGLKKALF